MTHDSTLVSVRDAVALIEANVSPPPPAPVPLDKALGRVLAETVEADRDQPPLDQSSIDGFAVTAGAGPGWFRCRGEWLPGETPASSPPAPGEAWRVYTGSNLPAGCGLVMIEDSETGKEEIHLRISSATELIRRRGGSIRRGDVLLRPGTRLGPGEIAVLASAGHTRPRVIPAPSVLHLTTGREIVPATRKAEPWQIRDTNGPLIRALLTESGYPAGTHRHSDENPRNLVAAVENEDAFDFLLVSGGSSVGKHDTTRTALETMGFEVLFHRVNARPGKPLLFARRGRQWAFGIPGNPVAHFAVFHTFLQRAFRTFAGHPHPRPLCARLNVDTPASRDPRETFWPATLAHSDTTLEATPGSWVHSGDLAALRGIDALIHFPESTRASAGDFVTVIPCHSLPNEKHHVTVTV